MIKNVFDPQDVDELISRIQRLNPTTKPQWGTMNVAQMLAHCCVIYDLYYENKHPKPNFIVKFLLKIIVKNGVVSEKPYKKNSPTASVFKVSSDQDFEVEKQRLIDYLNRTCKLGEQHFHLREYHSFGKLTGREWNIMFYKHLDHHLAQFGV
ncbi:MAG: DUF1569 domain-containing protein [Sumerlaeia bacterium]